MGGLASKGTEKMRQLMKSANEAKHRNKFGGGKYPSCYGQYPDCPDEAKKFALYKGKEGYKKMDAPRTCRLCPFFKW